MTIARPFVYTNRDFDSLLADLRRRMKIAIPEWTTYDASFESILLELNAYTGDILNFYIDRMGNEAFLRTAVLRESVLNIAYMLGYIPASQTAAVCAVEFTKAAGLSENVTIPAGSQLFAQVQDQQPVYFETMEEITIAAVDSTGEVAAVEGLTVSDELVGTSVGSEGQSFILHYPRVIRDSIHVYVLNGPLDIDGNPTKVEWTKYDRLIEASFFDKAFTTSVNADGYTFVIFGDGVSGQIPPVSTNILVTYRYGVGSNGNIGIGAVRSFRNGGEPATQISSVTNTTAAEGGSDSETIDSMRVSIPKSMRTIERAVSIDDYANLALRVPGVAKASAEQGTPPDVLVYIAPTTPATWGASAELLAAVEAYFEGPPRRYLVGTTMSAAGATRVGIFISLNLTINPRFRQDVVVKAVQDALLSQYAYEKRDLGELLSPGEVFHAVADIPGVDYVGTTKFSTGGATVGDIQLLISQSAALLLANIVITPTGGIVLS